MFELASPEPDIRWGGGLGSGGGGRLSIDLSARIGSDEVEVQTSFGAEGHGPMPLRVRVADVVMRALLEADREPELPLQVVVDRVDRTIDVDGVPTKFEGLGANGAWTRSALVAPSVRVTIKERGGVRINAVATCTDWSTARYHGPDLPPPP